MALTIRAGSITSLAARSLRATDDALGHVLEKISTGRRTVRAADDPAGIAVAMNLSVKARSARQAIRNANDGISVLSTAEGAVNEVDSILQRMRELAVQGASETLANTERTYVGQEFDSLEDEFRRIYEATEFNGRNLTDGTTPSLTVQVGVSSGTESEIDLTLPDIGGLHGMITTTDLSSASNSQNAITTVDTVHYLLNGYRSRIGSGMNRLESSINNQVAYSFALDSAISRISDADIAHASADMTKLQIRQQAGIAALSQAKSLNRVIIDLLK